MKKDPYSIIKYPLATEKVIRLIGSENKLVFIVHRRANKTEIKKAIEEAFKVKIKNIRTLIISSSDKKAYVKLDESTPAADVATELGLM